MQPQLERRYFSSMPTSAVLLAKLLTSLHEMARLWALLKREETLRIMFMIPVLVQTPTPTRESTAPPSFQTGCLVSTCGGNYRPYTA